METFSFQDLPEIPKIDHHIPVEEHWNAIF